MRVKLTDRFVKSATPDRRANLRGAMYKWRLIALAALLQLKIGIRIFWRPRYERSCSRTAKNRYE
jgi:hypothetical protein